MKIIRAIVTWALNPRSSTATQNLVWLGAAAVLVGWPGYFLAARSQLADGPVDASLFSKLFLDSFMQSLQVFTIVKTIRPGADNWLVLLARLLGMIVTGSIGIKLVSDFFKPRATASLIRIYSGHTIIVGLGHHGRAFATDIIGEAGAKVVVLDKEVRGSVAGFCALNHIRTIEGDGLVAASLRSCNVRHASLAFVATGSDHQNLGIAKMINGLTEAKLRSTPLSLAVIVEDPALAELVAHDDGFRRSFRDSNIDPAIINPARVAAVDLFSAAPLTRMAYDNSQARLKLVLIGSADVAIEVLLQFLRICPAPDLGKATIDYFVTDVNEARAKLIRRAPALLPLLSPVTGSEPNHEALTWAAELRVTALEALATAPRDDAIANSPADVTAIIIAYEDPLMSATAALELRQRTYRLGMWNVPSFVFLREETSVDTLLVSKTSSLTEHGARPSDRRSFTIFGQQSKICTHETLHSARERNARALHAAYLIQRAADHVPDGKKRPSEVPWEELPEVFRQANRRAVDHLAVKRHFIQRIRERGSPHTDLKSLVLDDVAVTEKLAASEHDSWRIDRELDGWRRGDRDDLRHMHPDLVAYEELPEPIREYDRAQVRFLVELDDVAQTAH